MTTTTDRPERLMVGIDPTDPDALGAPFASHLYRVNVSDVFERVRPCDIGIRDGQVVMITPPGSAAVMDSEQAIKIAAALVELARETELRDGAPPELVAAFERFHRVGGWGAWLRELLPPMERKHLHGTGGGLAMYGVPPGDPAPRPVRASTRVSVEEFDDDGVETSGR